jgi:hypothetical protein
VGANVAEEWMGEHNTGRRLRGARRRQKEIECHLRIGPETVENEGLSELSVSQQARDGGNVWLGGIYS